MLREEESLTISFALLVVARVCYTPEAIICIPLTSTVSTAPPTVFDILDSICVQDARYDSLKRRAEHAVICQPETQTKILNDVRSWADSTTNPICWLTGPAGTGKTTIAHTIAEKYDKLERLAATFFFWRKTGDRDDISRLVATLAYQIAQKIPSTRKRIQEALISNDSQLPSRALRDLSLEDQLSKLLVMNIEPAVPNLIIIDGLDECASREGICQLIEWIRKNKSPFRFLLTSRPELDIQASFTSRLADGRSGVLALSLTESEDEVRKYFVHQLENIWTKRQRVKDYEPLRWPLESDLNQLVEKSEGLFVYAATAIRYIGGKGFPGNRLKDVLKLHKGLDNLYVQVIEEAMEWDHFDIVMGSLMYLQYPLSINDLSRILVARNEHLTSDGIRSALGGCHSILVVPDDDTLIKPHHASLRDFLTDQSRSKTLFRIPAVCHAQLMFDCLSVITRAFNDGTRAPEYALISWCYHACCFLSTREASEQLKDEELIRTINLNWVKSWMIQALCWAGAPYLNQKLPPSRVGNQYLILRHPLLIILIQGSSRHTLDSAVGAKVEKYKCDP